MTIEMLNCDCMEYMKGLDDNAFDLAIVDPPYGIGVVKSINSVTGGVKHKHKEWDSRTPDVEYFQELDRVCSNSVVWGANYFVSKIQKDSRCWLVWDKNNGQSSFADCELAYTTFNDNARIKKVHWCGSAAKHETGRNKIHPTQKPIKLYSWILSTYAKPDQRILDTHLGSGSSAIAAHYFGCDFVGCELDEDYYKAAKERFDRETAQQALF